jgi:hypothetical protein
MKKVLLILVLGIFLTIPAFTQQPPEETITITTYYPSPYGVYNELRLFPQSEPSAACGVGREGTMYFDSEDNVAYICSCNEDGICSWGSVGGGFWAAGVDDYADDIYNTNTGNVGIGTQEPQASLHLMASDFMGTSAGAMIIQAAEAGLAPGVGFFNSNGKDRGALGVASISNQYAQGSQPGDVVLRSAQGKIIFATDKANEPPYIPKPYPAKVTIDNSGEVGLGVNNPTYRLHFGPRLDSLTRLSGWGKAIGLAAGDAITWSNYPGVTDNYFFMAYPSTDPKAPGRFYTGFVRKDDTSIDTPYYIYSIHPSGYVEFYRGTGHAGNINFMKKRDFATDKNREGKESDDLASSDDAIAATLFTKDSSTNSRLFVVDESGNETQLSPHDPQTGEWIFYSKNTKTGRVVRVKMEKLVKEIEKLTGKSFLEEWTEEPSALQQ